MPFVSTAFIPARKGSKGLPGKNIKVFHGKPLVQWSIEQAQNSGCFDRIVVSSDDDAVLAIADACGVVPYQRYTELAEDNTPIDAVLYDFFVRDENASEFGCLLNPTSPLRRASDIAAMQKWIGMKKYWSVVSVHWCDFIGWVEKPSNRGPLCTYNIGNRPNRQTRDDFYLENGSIYWFKTEILKAFGTMIANPEKTKLYPMPEERSLEIDDPFTWFLCEKTYEYLSMETAD